MSRLRTLVFFASMAGGLALSGLLAAGEDGGSQGEWRTFGGGKSFQRYSSLDQVNRDNVGGLRIVWRQPAVDSKWKDAYPGLRVSGNFRSTPVMVGGVLYAPNGVGLVRASESRNGGDDLGAAALRSPR